MHEVDSFHLPQITSKRKAKTLKHRKTIRLNPTQIVTQELKITLNIYLLNKLKIMFLISLSQSD